MTSLLEVRPGSRIASLPAALKPIALLLRLIYLGLQNILRKLTGGALLSDYPHRSDRMATKSIVGFQDDERFRHAYQRAVVAGGWDFGIPYRVHQALWCSRNAQKVEGDFVELGTGRGFIMSAVLQDFEGWRESERRIYLFDTFEQGWVERGDRGAKSPYYAETVEATRANFSEWERVSIVQGDVRKVLQDQPISKIAFLHVDLNHADTEVWAIRELWPRLSQGGLMLLDDFANLGREEQHDSLILLAKELDFEVLYTASGQGIVIK